MDFTINLIEQGLNGAVERQKLLANNISNVNTPNYKRKDIDFKNVLRNNLQPDRTLKLQTTDKGHMSTKVQRNNFRIPQGTNSNYKNDGNNIDIDTEMAYMAKNNLYYNTLTQRLTDKFHLLKNVIEKGGN